MMTSVHSIKFGLCALMSAALLVAGCGDDGATGPLGEDGNGDFNNGGAADAGGQEPTSDAGASDTFVPEEEEFLVREVATTDSFVFVPNSSEESNTVARIDGRNFSVRPVRVGQEPTAVRAASVEGVGDVAYVLCEGSSAVAVIRPSADQDGEDDVSLLPVPKEVNSLRLSPDGQHLLAYIDPDKPLDADDGTASLQTLALIRLGATAEEDEVFQLSVTRLISDIEFTEDGSEAFIIGREGINQLELPAISKDTFIAPLPLELSSDAFPPEDLEVEVAEDGSYLVARSSAFAGVTLYRPARGDEESATRIIELDSIPTDIDLFVRADGSPALIATLRGASKIALLDVDAALADDPADEVVETTEIDSVSPGLSQLTPDQSRILLYTTLVQRPRLGVYDVEAGEVESYLLRNRIRSVALSDDSETAVVVHDKRDGEVPTDADPLTFFQYNHGLTLFDFETNYLRPVTLQAEPLDLVITTNSGGTSLVYVMLESEDPRKEGVVRIDLSTYRTDFINLARKPQQIGRVAGKIFVNQQSDEGRITFIDIESGAKRTISGYELNAGID
ncbi:MAG: hypothetical protein ACQEVA_21390 [Myxococcota bacterium]